MRKRKFGTRQGGRDLGLVQGPGSDLFVGVSCSKRGGEVELAMLLLTFCFFQRNFPGVYGFSLWKNGKRARIVPIVASLLSFKVDLRVQERPLSGVFIHEALHGISVHVILRFVIGVKSFLKVLANSCFSFLVVDHAESDSMKEEEKSERNGKVNQGPDQESIVSSRHPHHIKIVGVLYPHIVKTSDHYLLHDLEELLKEIYYRNGKGVAVDETSRDGTFLLGLLFEHELELAGLGQLGFLAPLEVPYHSDEDDSHGKHEEEVG